VSPVRYGLGFYIPEDDILHSHRRENLKSYSFSLLFRLQLSTITSLSSIGQLTFEIGTHFDLCAVGIDIFKNYSIPLLRHMT
jgi:hypothetical protein